MDIFVVYDGAVQTYLQDSNLIGSQLPVLPPEVYRVKISWMAPDDVVSHVSARERYLMICDRSPERKKRLSLCDYLNEC